MKYILWNILQPIDQNDAGTSCTKAMLKLLICLYVYLYLIQQLFKNQKNIDFTSCIIITQESKIRGSQLVGCDLNDFQWIMGLCQNDFVLMVFDHHSFSQQGFKDMLIFISYLQWGTKVFELILHIQLKKNSFFKFVLENHSMLTLCTSVEPR